MIPNNTRVEQLTGLCCQNIYGRFENKNDRNQCKRDSKKNYFKS
jgi:hypothetical protein